MDNSAMKTKQKGKSIIEKLCEGSEKYQRREQGN